VNYLTSWLFQEAIVDAFKRIGAGESGNRKTQVQQWNLGHPPILSLGFVGGRALDARLLSP
jgi:hypothetical protein